MEYSEFSYSRSVRHIPLLVKNAVILDIDSTPRDTGWSYRFSDAAIVTQVDRECVLAADGVVLVPDNILSLSLLTVVRRSDDNSTTHSTTFTFTRMITSFGIIYHRFKIALTMRLSLHEGDSISFYLQENDMSSSSQIGDTSISSFNTDDKVSIHPNFQICISTNPSLSKSTQ